MCTSLFISAALILTANASIINKRAVSRDFSTFGKNNKFPNYDKFHEDVVSLDPPYGGTKVYCCNLPKGPATGEDSKALSSAFSAYATAATKTFNSLTSPNPALKDKTVFNVFSADLLQNLPTDEFSRCLIERVPSDAASKTKSLATSYQQSFNTALKTHKIPFIDSFDVFSPPKSPFAASNVAELAASSSLASIQ